MRDMNCEICNKKLYNKIEQHYYIFNHHSSTFKRYYLCNGCFKTIFPSFNKYYKKGLWGNVALSGCSLCNKKGILSIKHAIGLVNTSPVKSKWMNVCSDCMIKHFPDAIILNFKED